MNTKPYAHQLKEYEAHRSTEARALFWQQRTGKSKVIIDEACFLYQACAIDAVLVIAPNGVHRNWVLRQLPEHKWNDVPTQAIAWRSSEKKALDRVNQMLDFKGLIWLTFNTESIHLELAKKAIKALLRKRNGVMLVVDESHHFATPGAQRTKVARGLGKVTAYRRLLTGTAIENSPLQAFSQFEILKPGALGFETYNDFKNYFAEFEIRRMKTHSYEAIKAYRNLPELRDRMSVYTSVVLREDCEDLPAIQIDTRVVEMSELQQKVFRALKKQDIDFLLRNGFQRPPDGGALLTKLQQVEAGFLKTPLKTHFLDIEGKFEILEDEAKDRSAIVWCCFTAEIQQLYATAIHRQKRLSPGKIQYAMLYGATSPKDRTCILEEFQKGNIQWLFAQPKAMGEGYDMSAADMMVWMSQTPDAIVRSQANERATKVGMKSKQIVDLIVPRGVNEYFLKLTTTKTDLADEIARRGLQAILQELEP